MIRVLHVFGGLNKGGAETMIMNLYRQIDRSKIQFDFVLHHPEKNDYANEILSLGGKIHVIPKFRGTNYIEYINSWRNFFKTHSEYKLIHGHVRSTAALYLLVARKYGLKTIAHSHSTFSGFGLAGIYKKILQFPIRFIADYLFSCSNVAGEWLYGKKHTFKKNYYVQKNAIDINKYTFSEQIRNKKKRELNLEGKFVIGHIGRFTKAKNHKFLLKLFKEIYFRNLDSVLLLVGEGELKESIIKSSKQMGISDRIIFTGVRNDIPDLLQVMDMLLFPSLYEGLPVTLIEAQASGLPCVVSDNVTKEVEITDLLTYVCLDGKLESWIKAINTGTNHNRRQRHLELEKAGYDIKSSSTTLQNIYTGIIIEHE
ncbi:glycosyltransferase EpsF2 [Fictibacillus macauensis ZFHKF-1]|uniref:Glycosyltransferase EpsF2 n=1 Tax=Fictibacillus macauensis ZFHKF-1 TaxID=1196324 RepID=I8AEH9_9BACL|nr:glycosyltransferase family 1 protein [Fictibacillus macauensis]EIT83972.1 glycosyltransferase EpsF2 [Fictibacillus macauensis ZFHKF-1]